MIPNQENLFINTESCTEADPVSLRDWLAGAASISCLTLWQPWATWIMKGWKTIETRTHDKFSSLAGKTIAIHAGMTYDKEAKYLAWSYMNQDQKMWIELVEKGMIEIPRGCIVGTVRVEQSRRCKSSDAMKALIECRTGRFGLFLTDIRELEKPIAAKGAQGIWTYRKAASS